MKEITVQDLNTKKETSEDFVLIDVREDWEYHISNLNGIHIPLGDLSNRIVELDEHKNSPIIVMCRAGGRSAKAVELLEANGFKDVTNLKGGITAWGKEIDPSIPVA